VINFNYTGYLKTKIKTK